MDPLRDLLSGRCLQFAVAGNVIMDHITHDETTNKHQEADTLLINCITFSKLDGESACIYASDVDVAVLLIAHRNILSCGNVYFEVIAEKLNIDSLLEFLGNERAKCLLTLHCISESNGIRTHNHLVRKTNRPNNWAVLWVLIRTLHLTVCYYHVIYLFQSKSKLYSCLKIVALHCLTGSGMLENFVSKDSWTKLFLQIKEQDIFKAFESLQEDVMPKTIGHLAKFVCWGYINGAKHPNLTTLAEVQVHLYKQKNASWEKIPPTMSYTHFVY